MLQARRPITGTRGRAGKFDILIIAIIFLLIFVAFIFVLLKIIGHSEEHVETVRKTKVVYNESLRWRPESQLCEKRIRNDLEHSPERKTAEYTNLSLDETCLKLIGMMSRLEDLKLTRSTVRDPWLAHLTKLPLRSLAVSGCQLTDKSIPTIMMFQNLNRLEIGDTEVTDKGLELLSTSQTLTSLELNLGRRITNDGIKHLGKMKQLTALEIGDSPKLTGKCLSYLKELKYLSFLNLESMPLTNDELKSLSCFKLLASLDVSDCQLTDESLVEIAKLRTLVTLNLTGDDFTDKGLMSLKNLKKLRLLTTRNCPNLHEQAVKQFRIAVPHCQVIYSPGSKFTEKLNRKDFKRELQFLENEANSELEKSR